MTKQSHPREIASLSLAMRANRFSDAIVLATTQVNLEHSQPEWYHVLASTP